MKTTTSVRPPQRQPQRQAAVVVVRTGTANTASVLAGLERCGVQPCLSDQPGEVAAAWAVVLPGVGAFAAVMQRLHELDLTTVLRERIAAGRPTLGICLGLQVLAGSSEESPGVAGLGVLPVAVTRFNGTVRVPQLGWNSVEAEAGCRLLSDGAAYFANSYRLTEVPPGWSGAWSVHGEPFVAALERGSVLACQLHPELSGDWGHDLLRRWLAAAGALEHAEEVISC